MLEELISQLQIEHKILIVLCFMCYIGAMFIQIKDPDQNVTFADWILGFIFSTVGAVVCYFGVMSWANIGVRMGITIVASLVSYRTIVFIVSRKSQDQFASGFWNGIMGLLKTLVGNVTKDKNNE